ncbi:PepSY domain-containing protein [Mediterraneibacter sp. NSJ-55]|uniref:PepSY domain-containing protein n=1 Tax=Mediterraneibacter hominis TaxID=2763054 RepID=A0A923RSG2_9FIRM|nr:PepSY domain-containing protein [Mediterraneibacter hominis]MBC5689297.1 PepSY domain-containing protein [Mediterraneibacter hominis]
MMKKYMAAALVSIMVLGAFTGCGIGGGKDIGKDAALEAALNDAGVKEEDTTRLKVSEDRDDGRKTYEIQFDVNGKEYEYEIDASDGGILSVDTEMIPNSAAQNNTQDKNAAGNAGSGGSQTGQTQDGTGDAVQNSSNVAISMEEAMQIALERVPGATARDVKIELDFDDGQYKYEGDIIHEQREYDFEIDANTGTVLEWSEERR